MITFIKIFAMCAVFIKRTDNLDGKNLNLLFNFHITLLFIFTEVHGIDESFILKLILLIHQKVACFIKLEVQKRTLIHISNNKTLL